MTRRRLYDVRRGKWVSVVVHTYPRRRLGWRLKRVADSLRQTWRRLFAMTDDRTLYTFDPSGLTMVNTRTRRRHERLMRSARRRAGRRTALDLAARAVFGMVEMQKFIK